MLQKEDDRQENAYAHWLLGCLLEDKGNLDGAELCSRRAIELDPEDGDAQRRVLGAKADLDLGGSDLDLDELSDDDDSE